MPVNVAFLRGLNVGGHRVSMTDLKAHLESAGLEDVSTFIASGNVIFTSRARKIEKVEAHIESSLKAALGYNVDTFVRSMGEVRALRDLDAVAEAGKIGWNLHVTFLKEPVPAPVAKAFSDLETEDDRFRVAGREIFWLRNGKMTDSVVEQKHWNAALGKRTSTMRNFNTIERIVAKFG